MTAPFDSPPGLGPEGARSTAVVLRPQQPGDGPLLLAIYASTREAELALTGWSDAEKSQFLQQQFAAQRRAYENDYPGAEFCIIEVDRQPAGRLYVHRRPEEIRIMDIALLPAFRRQRIGSGLLAAILAEAQASRRPVTIHVESFNPARRLYQRLGFAPVASNGIYERMEWQPAPATIGTAPKPQAKTPLPGALATLVVVLVALAFFIGTTPGARGQGVSVTLVSSLVATQGSTLAYTSTVANATAGALTGVTFRDVLDSNTTIVGGSLNTSPLAWPDSYPVLGNVRITVAAPGVLANDVDPDGTGPGLAITAGSFSTAKGGNLVLSANGGFTYNPPPGFEGTDRFSYTLSDGEGFTDTGAISFTVTGMIWFVDAAAPAGGDGRLTAPFNSLAALAAINNGSGNNPGPGDSIFLFAGTYAGPLGLLNGQKLIGQGAGASLATITGLTPPAGSLPLPATGGVRPVLAGSAGVALASDNLLRGLDLSQSGGSALAGNAVGALVVFEAAITNSAGPAVTLAGGNLDVTLGSVTAASGPHGIRLSNCTGRFAVTGDGALAQNNTGGAIQNTSGNAVHLDTVANVSLARMNINRSAAHGIYGQNVNGLVIDWCNLANNGDDVNEAGIRLGDPVAAVNGLVGSPPSGANPTRLANTLIRASREMNVAVYNNGGVLALLEVTNVVVQDTRAQRLGADGFYVETRGTAVAALRFDSCQFSNHVTQGLQASALGQSALTLVVTNCSFTNNNEGLVLANANDADLTFDVAGNRILNNLASGASGTAIAAVNATTVTGNAVLSGKIRNNTIAGGGADNHLIDVLLAGSGNDALQITGNSIVSTNAQFSGIFVQAGEPGSGNPAGAVTVTGNTVSLGSLGSHGILVQSRINATLCAELAGNVATTGGLGLFGLNVRQRDASVFRLPGFAGPANSVAAITTFLQGKNPGSTVTATITNGINGGAACLLPLLAGDVREPASVELRVAGPPGPEPEPGTGTGADRRRASREVLHSTLDAQAATLTTAPLDATIAAARRRWTATGLSAEQEAALDAVRFQIADLDGWSVGASSGRLVQLDRRGAGHGWFIDPTPDHDEEFVPGPSPATAAAQRLDLLTAVLHEMGHHLGLGDDYAAAANDGGQLMAGFLPPGHRRLPVPGLAPVRALPAGSEPLAAHHLFAPINLGTIPAGKSITVVFRVAIPASLPPGVCVLSNQASVTATSVTGPLSALSDDPRTPAVDDATLTALPVPPIAFTDAATAVTSSGATLNGRVQPCGAATTYFFQWGTTTAYGNTTAPEQLPAGTGLVGVSAPVTGLPSGTLFHFRIIATNSFGTNAGGDRIFGTPLNILQQPTNALACPGATASFSVVASQGTATFQWQRRLAGAGSFVDLPGATGPVYTTPPLAAADDNSAYRVVISSPGASVASAEALLSVVAVTAPTVRYNFDSGLPPGTALYGNAGINAAAGVLELNANAPGQNGAFLTTDLAPGRVVRGFTAVFRARLLGGSSPPADGFSFNWAPDLPNAAYVGAAEEGEGSGLRVCVDTWDNGFSEAPAIDVWWGTTLVARRSLTIPFLVRGADFFDVRLRLSPDGFLDVLYACEPIFIRLPVTGYVPQRGARFGLGGRTGAAYETHSIDDLAIELSPDTTNGLPRITSIAPGTSTVPPSGPVLRGTGVPGQSYPIEASIDLVTWRWRGATATTAPSGLWDFTDSGGLPQYQFYRLRAAPQFPPGVVNWWRAEANFLDSFGPNDGAPINGIPFMPGQRGVAFSFDGFGQSVSVGAGPIPPPWTACFWVFRLDAFDPSAALLADASTSVKLEQFPGTRQLGITQFGVADYSFGYVVSPGVWTHLAFVAVPGSTTIYVNGVMLGAQPFTINLPRGVLGAVNVVTDRLRGGVDEIVLFNRPLSPVEIQQVLSATRGP